MEAAQILVITLLAAGGLAFYVRLASQPSRFPVGRPDYGIGDAVLATLLSLWFLTVVAGSMGKTLVVTGEVILSNIVLYFFLLCIITGFLIGRGRNPASLFGLRWPGWKAGLPLALVALLAAYPLILAAMALVRALGATGSAQDVLLFLQSATVPLDRLTVIAMAVVVAPVAEETIFRGYLNGVLRHYGGRWCGIVVSSMLFAAVHGHIPSLGGLFVLAMALSLVYERTGSLWAPIFMHSTFNSVTVVAALTWPELVN